MWWIFGGIVAYLLIKRSSYNDGLIDGVGIDTSDLDPIDIWSPDTSGYWAAGSGPISNEPFVTVSDVKGNNWKDRLPSSKRLMGA